MNDLHTITDYRDRALKREGRSEHIGINRRYHAKQCESYGVSHSNLVFNEDALEVELLGHDNAAEIMEVLFQNIDLEENGFRDISTDTEEGYTVSTVNASSRTGSKGIDDLEDDGTRDGELESALSELHRERCGTGSIINHSI